MEFLELVETIRAEDATEGRIYRGEGVRARRKHADPRYSERLLEAALLYERVLGGDKWAALTFQEALTTSDFPYIFGDIIDRQLLANYAEAPYTWNMVAKSATVSDFRAVKRFVVNGAESVLTAVAQQAAYPESSVSDAYYTYSVAKYGRVIPFSWETMINDDLDALKDIPMRYGKAARRSEEKFVTQLYCGTTGPDATLYSSGHKNIVNTTNGATSTNPPLSTSGLQDAMTVLGNMVDSDGEPITIDGVTLVVPPALEVTANNIIHATEILVGNFPTSGANQQIRTVNWLRNRVKVAVNSYIPIVASSSNGNTSWWLFADPTAGRPALEFGKLRGHESPEIFIKAPNATRIGGGAMNALDGDFDTDSILYKVRHVFGGVTEEYRATVASNGSGS